MIPSGLKHSQVFDRMKKLGLVFAEHTTDMPICHCKPEVFFLETGNFGLTHQDYELKLMQFIAAELDGLEREHQGRTEHSMNNSYRFISCLVEKLGGETIVSDDQIKKSKDTMLIMKPTTEGMALFLERGGEKGGLPDGLNNQ